jgi:branched-chain amino acid transport system permease protein
MEWGILFQQMVSGLALGCVYGLIALGYSFLFNAVGLINIAQGSFVMIGAYVYGVWFTNQFHWPFVPALACLIVVKIGRASCRERV